MANFNARIIGVDALMKRFSEAPNNIMSQAKVIIDEAVVNIQSGAKRDVPVKSSKLRNSITHRSFSNGKASISAGNSSVRYAPYVEFGTGNSFQIPFYTNVNMDDLEGYAATFRRSKLVNSPHRPFMFNNYDKELGIMIEKLKTITI
jgi:HK97 gp10 family phage protein